MVRITDEHQTVIQNFVDGTENPESSLPKFLVSYLYPSWRCFSSFSALILDMNYHPLNYLPVDFSLSVKTECIHEVTVFVSKSTEIFFLVIRKVSVITSESQTPLGYVYSGKFEKGGSDESIA